MKKETVKNVVDSSVYKKLLALVLLREKGICPFCRPHGGCNARNKYTVKKNWKKYRKTQYKNETKTDI